MTNERGEEKRAEERGGEERGKRREELPGVTLLPQKTVLRRPVLCPLFPGRAVL